MDLITHELEVQLQEQFVRIFSHEVDYMELPVLCKIFHPFHPWTWYVISQDPEDPDYLYGIVNGFEVEVGSFSKSDFTKNINDIPFERDLHFEPQKALEVFRVLLKGNHI